ncbi:MAG: ABC transporter ATP-binding protein [Candidatus Heimdallarchaeum aukensis]|uniref:ABC transporter ATP-binding protein n=1 Tax=Candidatus Heimdallarchaeum aukensis TaxID=2876573 RepID=A0A9Y1BM93_9ARCH|nr:MAG: ABC transporter ATP-binding protein [Candidatus Heimdallarchaeum aukensis]
MALVIDNLSFSYDIEFELREIKIQVEKGGVVSLLGPNGSGKTTLLKCICTLLKPKKGCIFIDKKSIFEIGQRERAKIIGYVPQNHNPLFALSALDFVLLGRTPYTSMFSLPSEEDYSKAEEMLKLVNLYHMRDRSYTQISGGERQLLLIARALTQEPEVLILDEPTAHLDLKNQLKVMTIINKIVKERKICAIMSQHDPNLALRFSNFIVILAKGQIIGAGKPEVVINEANIAKAYGINARIINNNHCKIVYPISVYPVEVTD